MKYIDYTNLGFKRNDSNDQVEFDRTGYMGFYLTKEVNENMYIEVNCTSLNSPILCILHEDKTHVSRYQIDESDIINMFRNT